MTPAPIDTILPRLEGVRARGARYTARCPAHEDRHPSLSIREGDGGAVLVRCHAGCDTAAVMAAMGLNLADLFPPSDRPPHGGRWPARPAARPAPRARPEPDPRALLATLEGRRPLAGTPGAVYVERRGIPVALAEAAGLEFHPRWYGRPAVLFAAEGPGGELVAAYGRYVASTAHPKGRDSGRKSAGVFGTPGWREAESIVLVEGQFCALTWALAGTAAVAVCGSGDLPDWLPRVLAGRRVYVASDADPAGDRAAERWTQALRVAGADPRRLRPEDGRDWNDRVR